MRAERTLTAPAPERFWSRPRRLASRSQYDLCIVVALAVCLPLVVQMPLPLVRGALGLAVVLFAPGYGLTAAIFARHDDLDSAARLGFSFVLSAALLPLFGLALDRSPWGITLWPMVTCLTSWLLLISGVAALRRWQLGDAAATPALPRLGALVPWRTRGAILATVAALFLVVWVWGLAASYTQRSALTEFFVLNPSSAMVEFYPRQVALGQPMEVLVGLTNHEGASRRYRVEARSSEEVVASTDWFVVEAGATWQAPLHYALPRPGADQMIDILLFRPESVEPFRRLTLWVDVEEPRR